jgi:O-antigen/teichoic acid export membrane protein
LYVKTNDLRYLGVITGGAFAIQLMKSVMLKSHDRIVAASLIDSGIYYCLFLWVLYFFLTDAKFEVLDLVTPIGCYILFLGFWSFKDLLSSTGGWSFDRYTEVVKFGIPIVLSGFLMSIFIMGGRISAGFFFGIEGVAYYSFYFRLASAIVIIHQIVNIVYFKRIYQGNYNNLDFYFSAMLIILFTLSMALWWVLPIVLSGHLEILKTTYQDFKWLYLTLSFTTIFWVSMALNENMVYREKLATKFNKKALLVVLVLAFTLFSMKYIGLLTLQSMAALISSSVYCVCEIQLRLLKVEREIHLKNLILCNRLIVGSFILVCVAQLFV